ncbi:MAG: type II toxin-antitoxin system RelE/ParE family toxin [Chthoniobacter sp.]
MPRIERSRASISDYEEIWRYIARDNPVAADRMITTLERQLSMLAAMPGAGRKEPKLAVDLRSFPVGNYLIFYRPLEDGLAVVRVLHGARDITSEYFEEE